MNTLTLLGALGSAACGGACIFAGKPTAGILILAVAVIFTIGTLGKVEQRTTANAQRR